MKQATFAALFWPIYLGAGICMALAETYPNLAFFAVIGFALSIGFTYERLGDAGWNRVLVLVMFLPFGAIILGIVLPFIKSKEVT